MKLTNLANLITIGLVLSAAVTGCRKQPDYLHGIPPGRTDRIKLPPTEAALPPIPTPPPVTESTNNTGPAPVIDPDKLKDYIPNATIFEPYTVHFAFDSSVLRTEDKPKAAAVADYLKSHPAEAVRVEGHCDERGTSEYNRALGERRALAAREELVKLGIDAVRVETVTYGFDRPLDPGHNEAAWGKNRRAAFILLTPPAK